MRLRLGAVAVFATLYALGWTDAVDHLLFDRLAAWRAEWAPEERAQVLLVEWEDADAAGIAPVVEALREHEPAGIVLTVPSVDAVDLPTDERGSSLLLASMPPSHEAIDPLDRPDLVEEGGGVSPSAWSLAGLPSSGVRRCQLAGAAIDGRTAPSFEVAVARSVGFSKRLAPCFGIAFRGGAGSLPSVSAERVLAGGLVRDLVEGRWVIVGSGADGPFHGVDTPTTRGGERMSVLEFQGHALDGLLRGSVLRSVPRLFGVVLLTAVALGLGFVEPQVRSRWLIAVALLAAGAVVFAASAAYLSHGVYLPVFSGLAVVTASHLLTLRLRLRVGGQAVSSLAQGLMIRLRSRLLPDVGDLADEPWEPIADGIGSGTGARRMAFLAGGGDARPLFGWRCDPGEIDLEGAGSIDGPLARAREDDAGIRLGDPLLPPVDGETQGLLALRFGGECLGYWLWSAPFDVASRRGFDALLRNYARQLAEVMFHRGRVGRAVRRGEVGAVVRSGVGEAFSLLEWLAVMLEQRLLRSELLLRGLGSSVAVFDLVGRVQEVTDVLLERLGREGISPHALGAVDLVSRLARIDPEEARAALNEALAARASVTLPAYLGSTSEPSTYLILSAIDVADEPAATAPGRGALRAPAGVIGLSMELLETSSMQVLSEVKSRLTERLGDQLARDLGEMKAALQLLRMSDAGVLREQALGLVDGKMASVEGLVEECREYLAIDLREIAQSRYPVELNGRIQQVADERSEVADRREVAIELSLPEHAGSVLATPTALEDGFRSVFDFLLQDAEPETPIWARVFENEATTQVLFSNRGSGYVQEEVLEIITGGRETDRPVDRAVSVFAEQVAAWGGSLTVESHIGVGTQFELNLDRSRVL